MKLLNIGFNLIVATQSKYWSAGCRKFKIEMIAKLTNSFYKSSHRINISEFCFHAATAVI